MKKPAHRLSLIVLTAIFITSAYGAVGEYEVIDLGTLGAGATFPTGINNLGQIVGHSSQGIFLWQDGLMTDLGVQSEFAGGFIDINNKGMVAGSYIDSSYAMHAFIWDNIEGLRPVEMPESFYTLAMGINDHNQVALTTGIDMGGFAEWYVYLYTEGEEPIDLGFPEERQTIAYGLSNAGHVVGFYFYGDVMHAFMWYQGEAMDLPALGGESSGAIGVNDEGIVVGMAETADDGTQAVMWSDGELIELGGLGGTGQNNIAVAINNSDVIVGCAETTSANEHAFIWSNGEMCDLNELIDPDLGVELEIAYAINDKGWIAAMGTNAQGQVRAYLVKRTNPIAEAANTIEAACVLKDQILASITGCTDAELAACDTLDQMLATGDFAGLAKGDIVKAIGKLHSATQHQDQATDALDRSTAKLIDALHVVGIEYEPPQITQQASSDSGENLYNTACIAISEALAEKKDLLETLQAMITTESETYAVLEAALAADDYGDLAKGDVVKAMQRILAAMQHDQQCVNALQQAIRALEEALEALAGLAGGLPLPEPVAYRSFDGGQGDIAYETVGGHDGTVYGAEWLGAETLEVLAVNKLDDSIDCSPAITGKEMYLKGKKNRYCIAASE